MEAPFVGRDDELRLVKDLFHATTRERRTRLVSVIGPAGIGKSRLAWEFNKYTDGLIERMWFHDGRSPAYGDGISFWALGEMVRRRAGLLETDDEATTRAKIADTVATHVPEDAERRWIERALLALLGIDAGQVATDELFAAWRTFFERMAATAPVIMVFEDFHHADSGLVDFVDHLLEWSRNLPLYVVTLARPELLERRPDWGAGKRSFTSISLEPLPGAAMYELLAGLVPGLPENATRAIVARADGVPLYAVETVRMLLAEGKLTLDDGVYRPSGDLTSLAVPETLTALIASRLDALAADDRALISDAAVLGQSFTLAGLASVSGLDTVDLTTRLRALVRREILTIETDSRSPERGQYAFVQALIREVAYNALAKRDRKARHLAAARFFESLDTDEIAGGLAGHYLAAYRNSPEGAEADAVAAQARIALRAAAERASALGAYDQALTFLAQALTVTTDPVETADLLEQAGEAGYAAGRFETAEHHLVAAIAARRDLNDRPGIARATAALGRTVLNAYRTPDAMAILEPAADEFADLSAHPAGVALNAQFARAYFMNDDNHRAIAVLEGVLEAAEHADLRGIVADALVTRGSALITIGRVLEGLGALRTGIDLAEANGLWLTVLRAYNNRSEFEAVIDPRAGLETSRAGITLANRLGVRNSTEIMAALADSGLRTGDWIEALAVLDEALATEIDPGVRVWLLRAASSFLAVRGEPVDDRLAELARLVGDTGDLQLQANLSIATAFAAFAAGELSVARAGWQRAAELSSSTLPPSLARAARAALWAGDSAGAAADLAALDASGVHGPAIEADRRTIRAGLAALEGNRGAAISLYRESLRLWRDLGLAWDEALCGLDMAMLLDPAEPEVRAAAEAGREILTRLGAPPFLERLEAATNRQSSPAVPERTRSRDASSV